MFITVLYEFVGFESSASVSMYVFDVLGEGKGWIWLETYGVVKKILED